MTLICDRVARREDDIPATSSPPITGAYQAFVKGLTAFVLPAFEAAIPKGAYMSTEKPILSQTSPISRHGIMPDGKLALDEVTAVTSEGAHLSSDGGHGSVGGIASAATDVSPVNSATSVLDVNTGGAVGVIHPDEKGRDVDNSATEQQVAGEGDVEEEVVVVVARILKLTVTDTSLFGDDVAAAKALLPQPSVPAPDPKRLSIPQEKVRQLLRHPASRVQRVPLPQLEILPPLPLQQRSSSRPGSSKATLERTGKDAGRRTPAGKGTKGTEGLISGSRRGLRIEERAVSGALEENPYRWVVSGIAEGFPTVSHKSKGGVL